VPHLPPRPGGFLDVLQSLRFSGPRFAGLPKFDYESVGTLQYIDRTGHIDADSPGLVDARNLSLAWQIVRFHFVQIAADHAIACGSGSMTVVCPSGVCG
jgi:hypothetical protein